MAGLDLAAIAAIAAKTGVSFDPAAMMEAAKEADFNASIKASVRAEKLSEADAVLRSLHAPHSMTTKRCAYCGNPFKTNYCAVSCCSTPCRRKHLEAAYGIPWNPEAQKVWGDYEPPLTISSDSTEALYRWAKAFVEEYEEVRDRVDQPVENPSRVQHQRISIGCDGYATAIPVGGHQSQTPLSESPQAPYGGPENTLESSASPVPEVLSLQPERKEEESDVDALLEELLG